jgi:hypothetical protein
MSVNENFRRIAMGKIKAWEKPTIMILGVEKTKKNPPGDGEQPNDDWCPRHGKYHGNNHS